MTAPATVSQIVTFRLGDELFAADIFSVERVLRYTAPTPVPNVPSWIEGVIDYQQRVVPVIDLRRRFELPPAPVPADARILVLSVDDEWVAATVDGVLDVSVLDAGKLAPPPPLFRGLTASYVRGVVRRGERLVVFLDVARLFCTDERIVLERPSEAQAGNG
ncbi:MAG TPA: chemotaxis protein CheW [Gemmatimonadaceae bacterium]|nr:chemotaxis protein CheW [Gemmatimonadaceae bacterium]